MKLIVGLGNPGKKYEATRHNVGFDTAQRLAQRHAAGSGRSKFEGELRECQIGGERTLLLVPHTFMNLSGRSVRQTVDFFKLVPDNVLVVCDDFHLPLGTIRLRPQGSDGGQKGLADIIAQLTTNEVPRLRIGIGPVPQQWDPADFVLGRFDTQQRELVDEQIERSCEAAEVWIREGITEAMNQFNRGQTPDE